MHRWAAGSRETAHRPMARTAFRTNSTSTSEAYSLNSSRTWSMLSRLASRIMISSFSILT